MTTPNWNDPTRANAGLDNPHLPAAELMAIAAAQPGLWPRVARHPAAYPDLLVWMRAQGFADAPPYPGPTQPPAGPGASLTPAPAPTEPSPGRHAWAVPSPAASSKPTAPFEPPPQAGAPGDWPARPDGRRGQTGLAVGIAAAVIALVVGGGAGLWVLTHGDNQTGRDQTGAAAASQSAAETPTERGGDESATPPSPTGKASEPSTSSGGSGGSVSLVTDADPITYQAGETPFTGMADLAGGSTVEVGFVLSADGGSLHDLSFRIQGGALEGLGYNAFISWNGGTSYDVSSGVCEAVLGADGGIVLVLEFIGADTATGVLTYKDEMSDYSEGWDSEAKTLVDLGSGPVNVKAM
ncbi:MAG: hypothetical protein LBE08_03085 [Bifidobacteriaceae bacterium]|jgi:hypothetical protein|nr:hypothetical protein [Bifidobacteriaceae bacterium]